MMRLALALVLGSLAACGSEPGVDAENASVQEVAEQVRDATKEPGFIRAGKWVSEVSMEELSAPGMPPEMRERMKAMVPPRQSFESCLTAEEARRPKEDFFAQGNNQCRYDHFRMGDGKIDAKMRCDRQGMTQVMELDGTYSPDTYTMRMTTSSQQRPAGGMRMTMRVDAKRIGECEAKPA